MSKGHATLMMYSVLAERGYFPVEELKTFRKNWSRLPGHPDMNKVPGIDMTTGSLGQGLAVANGMALAGRAQGKDYYCYALLGDGELQEGMVWEAAMAAAHYKLDHVIAFVDRNGLQIDGTTEQVMGLEPLADKWRSFGWHVQEIDGHDVEAISRAVDEAKSVKGKPSVIIAKTVKGKGVSLHGKPCGIPRKGLEQGTGCRCHGGNGGLKMKLEKNELVKSTRAAYGEVLQEIGEEFPDVVVMDADLSESTMTCHFAEKYPDRFYNMGIAEQSMMGTAAGLVSLQHHPYLQHFRRVRLHALR